MTPGLTGNGNPDTPVRLSPGDQWTLGKTKSGDQRTGVQKAGEMGPQASGWSWACRGTFAAPDLDSIGGFYWGAVQQCTQKLPQQISVKVNLCVQDPGGPGHFRCDVYKGGKKGDLVNLQVARTDAYVKGCNRSKYSTYVQVAYARGIGVSPLTALGEVRYRDVLAEIAVGRILSRLSPQWMVMHAVPIGRRGSDLDHLLVGPPGVFTVNTTDHSGKTVWVLDRNVVVADVRCDEVRSAEDAATRVARVLGDALGWPVPVRSVVAVLDRVRPKLVREPAGVDVMEARRLVKWLNRKDAVLSPLQRGQIESVIGTSSTWGHQVDNEADLDRGQEFAHLQWMTRQARWRRRLWNVVLFATVACVAAVVIWTLSR